MVEIYVGIGSNLGKRRTNIDNAISLLETRDDVKCLAKASFYETEPVGPIQPWFINTAIEIGTDLSASDFFSWCKEVEKRIGRVDSLKWGPRLVDLDILLVGNRIIHTDDLDIPHPEIQNRRFVFFPLLELNPDLRHPVKKVPIQKLLDDADREKKVIKLQ